MVNKILKGKNNEAQMRLNVLSKSLGENPNILWYPSAGNDYRDILELSPTMALHYGITELPNLFIHTDYSEKWLHFNEIVYEDSQTIVRIDKKFELQLAENITYYVDPEFVDFPGLAPTNPTVLLLDITVSSKRLGIIQQAVLYFLFENINFLDEIILKHAISISHIVKVREGCGFGGNRKSISLTYAFLSALKTKYLIIDKNEHTDFNIINRLKNKHRIATLEYDLKKTGKIYDWSGFNVNIFSTLYTQQALDDNGLRRILTIIKDE